MEIIPPSRTEERPQTIAVLPVGRCSSYITCIMTLLAIVKLLSDKESSTVLACVCEGNVFEGNTNISRQPLGSKSLISGSSLRLAVQCDCNLAQVLKKCSGHFFKKHIRSMIRISGCTDDVLLNSLQPQFRDILRKILVYFHECSCAQAARGWRLLK